MVTTEEEAAAGSSDFEQIMRSHDLPIHAERRTSDQWRKMACALAATLVLAIGGLVYLGRLPKSVAYIVERSSDGSLVYGGAARPRNMDNATWSAVMAGQFDVLIESWRTVTSDREYQKKLYGRTLSFVGNRSAASQVVNDWFNAHDPIALAATGVTVTVHNRSYELDGEHTIRLWWEETTRTPDSQAIQKRYEGRFVYSTNNALPELALRDNPLGILVTEADIHEETK